jgi:hypothetical protein
MEYIVYCEWYGKKLKINVESESVAAAKKQIREAVIFHKLIKNDKNDVVDELMDIFGMKR